MKLLALDTSTSSSILGLKLNDQVIDASRMGVREHSRDLLPAIDSLLNEHEVKLTDLDAIVFGQGPGSFTGLRIAAGVVQGLAFGAEIPVAPVSTLAALAGSAQGRDDFEEILVVIHAREQEVYGGFYDASSKALGDEFVSDVNELPDKTGRNIIGVGNAWHLQEKIEKRLGQALTEVLDESVPSLVNLLALGEHCVRSGNTVTALDAIPVYLREQVAQKQPRS